MTVRERLLNIKDISRKGKTIAGILALLSCLAYGMFNMIEHEADEALGQLDSMVLE